MDSELHAFDFALVDSQTSQDVREPEISILQDKPGNQETVESA